MSPYVSFSIPFIFHSDVLYFYDHFSRIWTLLKKQFRGDNTTFAVISKSNKHWSKCWLQTTLWRLVRTMAKKPFRQKDKLKLLADHHIINVQVFTGVSLMTIPCLQWCHYLGGETYFKIIFIKVICPCLCLLYQ
jgi:hypothetical protein